MTKKELMLLLADVPDGTHIVPTSEGLRPGAGPGVHRESVAPGQPFLNGFTLEEILAERTELAYYERAGVAVLYVAQNCAGQPVD